MMESQDGGVEGGQRFSFKYRGSTEVDRHYSKPMLPWIISEIKNQQKSEEVSVEITWGNVVVRSVASGVVTLSHTVRQIHKCVMEQADHTCFLYTLKPMDKEQTPVPGAPGYVCASDPNQLVPANISDQNYQCYLMQASNEQHVRNFFECLRQQPREVQQSCSETNAPNSFNSLPDLFVNHESQFFEVLFVGRVKVSHSKVPPSFIDDAISAFKIREKTRQRHMSGGDSSRPQPNTATITFQQEGSGVSVPNISFSSLMADPDSSTGGRRSSKDFEKGAFGDPVNSDQDKESQKHPKVRFSLWSSTEETQEPSVKAASQPSDAMTFSSSTSTEQAYLLSGPSLTSAEMITYLRSCSVPEEESRRAEGSEETNEGLEKEDDKTELAVTEPFRQRLRTISGDSSQIFRRQSSAQEQGMRARAGSIGSMTSRSRIHRPSECELKMLSHDFNRTMLYHIGRNEIQLINPEKKSVQLNKNFKDIAHCCQGIKHNDHFGFICRELNGEVPCYVGYVFMCQINAVTDEIMQALSRAFTAVHEAQVRERQENLLCDQCPMRWFSMVCAEVEGMPAAKAHTTVMKRLSSLPEEEKSILIAKYEGAEASETQTQNNILMMLLRTHFETKQATHSHLTLPGGGVKPDTQASGNIESSLRRAKKSLTTSFNQLLKRDGRESESAERETAAEEEQTSGFNVNQVEKTHPLPTSSSRVKMEGLSDSPLGHRPRSSTVSSAGGDAMRREFMAKRAAAKQKMVAAKAEPASGSGSQVSAKRNIFLKVGSPTPRSAQEEDNSGDGRVVSKSSTSFRHAILQRVVSPPKRLDSFDQLGSRIAEATTPTSKKSKQRLKIIWKKAVFQQILLNRFERENLRLRAHQQEVAMQRVRLNYEEDEILVEAVQAWQLMLTRPSARIDSNILHSGIKQGIPKSVRGEVWQLLAFQYLTRNPKLEPQFPGYKTPYEDMIRELTSQHHAILIDLGRTFPTHPYYVQTLGPGQLALFNVLKAYSLLDKDVGYCQGLSFVGGVLLLHVEEEVAYSLLQHLMFIMGCRQQYRSDLIGLQVQMYQLSRLLRDKLKNLHDHFEDNEVTPQLFAAPWFLTLFASQFPLNFVSRVFDLLFMDGMEAVFCVALVLLKTHEEALLACDSFEQIMDYMKNSLSTIHTHQVGNIISQACDCSLSKELQAYEVEYHVLQEESALSPLNNAEFNKLKEANKNLKRQNLDLLEQLHHGNSHQHALEASNQSLQQSQHHLEVRVRWLELERGNLKQLVSLLAQKLPPPTLAAVPANLQRFLPNEREKKEEVTKPDKKDAEKEQTTESDDKSSSLPSQTHHQHSHPARSVTMDYGMMQRYLKNLVGHD
ncbi:TBC1 domain family member 1 [Chionoecetes opilio]|uniref:TBC1 domain family member 1 n=1 Tax=Chionoecetes opilio TaxID=41210 RepID=A0A8J4Y2R3_CHIOP|nr:TBC1 domain family member 1 [Chionoecetes opilio]